MKQYTNAEQTAKLIELGFEKPIPQYHKDEKGDDWLLMKSANYSIGELIETLLKNSSKHIRYVATKRAWVVDVDVLGKSGCAKCYRGTYHAELVDALFEMIVKLKEEGVI